MKLYELPRNSKLRVTLETGEVKDAIFGHLDGMYSCCWLEEDREAVFHLAGFAPVKLVDGRYEIDDNPDES